jgi:hypothetical protein
MKAEDVMEIQGSDPDTQKDLFRVLPQASYEILSVDTSSNRDMEYFYRIRLKKCAKNDTKTQRKGNGRKNDQIGR